MKILKRATLAMLMIMGSLLSKGQQDPLYTQYTFNLQTVNPAYVGYWQTVGLTAISQHQWVDTNSPPAGPASSLHAAVRSQNVEIGFNVVLYKIGLEMTRSVSFDYSY